jgi:hypothetical protein
MRTAWVPYPAKVVMLQVVIDQVVVLHVIIGQVIVLQVL